MSDSRLGAQIERIATPMPASRPRSAGPRTSVRRRCPVARSPGSARARAHGHGHSEPGSRRRNRPVRSMLPRSRRTPTPKTPLGLRLIRWMVGHGLSGVHRSESGRPSSDWTMLPTAVLVSFWSCGPDRPVRFRRHDAASAGPVARCSGAAGRRCVPVRAGAVPCLSAHR